MTDVHAMVTELTRTHTNAQIYDHEHNGTAIHSTRVPPLITQLDDADPANTGAAFRATPGSRPPTSLEALDTLAHIDHEAASWIRRLGHDDPGTTIACVTKLYSLTASADHCGRDKPVIEKVQHRKTVVCCDVHRIEKDIRRWWTQARIVSGWDTPSWAPNNTCMVCSERRSLRIKVEDLAAFCTNCRETWDSTNIGILAQHVREENGEVLGAAEEVAS